MKRHFTQITEPSSSFLQALTRLPGRDEPCIKVLEYVCIQQDFAPNKFIFMKFASHDTIGPLLIFVSNKEVLNNEKHPRHVV